VKPRSVPGGSRERPKSPSPIPVGPLGRDLHPAVASRPDPARREAAPSPRARIGAEAPPVARFPKSARPKPPAPRGTSRGRSPSKSPFGSRRRPRALPVSRARFEAEASRRAPSGRGWGVSPSPSPSGSGHGAIPAAFAGSAGLPAPKGAFRRRHGGFVKPRFASACACAGAASSASRLPPGAPRPRRSDGAFPRPASQPSVRRSVSGPSPFRPRMEAASFARFGKGESACG
jgi:hypothetical protein